MRLAVHGDLATVALGSRGAAVIDIVSGAVLVEAFPSEPSNSEVFERHFDATLYIRGADTTVELAVDAEGRVARFDRVYRGAYPLAATVW